MIMDEGIFRLLGRLPPRTSLINCLFIEDYQSTFSITPWIQSVCTPGAGGGALLSSSCVNSYRSCSLGAISAWMWMNRWMSFSLIHLPNIPEPEIKKTEFIVGRSLVWRVHRFSAGVSVERETILTGDYLMSAVFDHLVDRFFITCAGKLLFSDWDM